MIDATMLPRESADSDRLDRILLDRIEALKSWITQNAPEVGEQQLHLDDATPERAYWHFGYLNALEDVRELLDRYRSPLN